MTKKVSINNKFYDVLIKKSKRAKRIQLKVYRTGEVILSVPHTTSNKRAIAFLEQNSKWIEKKLSKLAFNMNKFRYLGDEIKISIITEKKDTVFFLSNENELVINQFNNSTVDQLFDEWLFRRAEEYIPSRVHELALTHNFHFNKVKVKRLLSRWGSCSSNNNLSFNYKLMCFNYKIIDYVIIHELCHLKHMNHSKAFWDLVASLVPDYKELKHELKK